MSFETNEFDPWDPVERSTAEETDEKAIPWTLYKKGSPSEHYLDLIGDRVAEHTGDRKTYLTAEEEHRLAAVIQDGLAAKLPMEELKAKVESLNRPIERDLRKLAKLRARFEAGREAERVLIECNLRNATYLARLSMNIRPGTGTIPDDEDVNGGRPVKRRSTKRHIVDTEHTWSPGDLTRLRSPYADYDERVQVVNEAIVKAARNFKPGMKYTKGPNIGKPIRFQSYIITGLRGVLARHVRAYERPGIYIPVNRVEEIHSATRDPDNQAGRTPEELAGLWEWNKYRDHIFIDELMRFGAADEELETDDEVSVLPLEEVVADTDTASIFDIVQEGMSVDVIDETLGTLSEREAGVIRLRFGLKDGTERTLQEIGDVYGIKRERVRIILDQTLGKLRHPSRSDWLKQFMNIGGEVEAPQHTRPFPVLKTERPLGAGAIRLSRDAPQDSGPVRYADEEWQEPARSDAEEVFVEYEPTARFREILFSAGVYTFRRSFAEAGPGTAYPKLLVETIRKQMGETLSVSNIADFWNSELEVFVAHLDRQVSDVSLDRVSQLFSKLLAERMNDHSLVELAIPEVFHGKLGYLGAWLEHGELVIHGNLGSYAGYQMGGSGCIRVNGSVGDCAAAEAHEMARLEIMGDAGDYAARQAHNQASLHVYGAVGDYCGYRAQHDIDVQVLEDAGEHLAHQATGGTFIISGTAASSSPDREFTGTVEASVRKRT